MERIARSRALTDEKQRITYRASGLSFRQYNELYEKWLSNRYSDKIKPFTKRPLSAFDMFLTETAHSWRVELNDMNCSVARRLEDLANTKGYLTNLAWIWRDLGQKKREELVLGVWEDMCARAEEGEYPWSREETPEMTLDFAAGLDDQGVGNWIRLWEKQGQSEEEKRRSLKDPDALPYRNLRNAKWDRVNGVLEIEASAVPVKKSIRAFVADGVGRRNYHLRQFIEELHGALIGLQMVHAPTTKQSTKYDTVTSEEKGMLKNLNKEGVSITVNELLPSNDVCTYCHTPRQPNSPNLQCSRCHAKANRIVRYCSVECQRAHYSVHKSVCGKLLTSVGSVPSLSSSSENPPARDASNHHSSGETPSKSPAVSLSSSSKYPSVDRSKWHNMLNDNPGAYWIVCHGHPDEFDPRKPLDASPMDVPWWTTDRYATRQLLRSIAFRFIDREDDVACDLVIAIASVEFRRTQDWLRHISWIAKLWGRDGDGINDFIKNEFPVRLKRGMLLIKAKEEYRLVDQYFQQKEKAASEPDSAELVSIASVIQSDLENDPEAIWFTCHPAFPDKNMTQAVMRIVGPILNVKTEHKESKFAKEEDSLILTKAIRRHILIVLNNPGGDLDALGILMVSIADKRKIEDRTYRWFLRRTSMDLGLPEDLLEKEMERMRVELSKREGEEWDKIREGLEIIASQGPRMPPDLFPPLSSYSSQSPSSLDNVTATLQATSIDDASTSEPSTSAAAAKKKRKNRKKSKK